MKRDINLYHNDRLYYEPHWKPSYHLFDVEDTNSLKSLKSMPVGTKPDVLYRIDSPFDFTPAASGRLFVFGTCEYGIVRPDMLAGNISLTNALSKSDAVIITPSNWSKNGFLRSGAPAERVIVIPHGIDTNLFRVLPEQERISLRKRLGWQQDSFVLLSVGAMTENKGIRYLLKAVAILAQRYPQIKLCLKGLDSLYTSRKNIEDSADLLTPDEYYQLQNALVYIGGDVSFSDMANIYNACDAYVSPYIAEGFNMPVLESAACGLSVICTAGGPTDDFVHESFSKKISSTMLHGTDGRIGVLPDLGHLIELIKESIEKGTRSQETRLESSSIIAKNFTWHQAVDKLMDAFKNS
jgi:glycosyltransferase involved in cell wall biosynthesis